MSPKPPAETLPAQTPQAVPEVGSTVPSAPPAGSGPTDPTQVKPTAPVAANPTDPTPDKPATPMMPPARVADAPAIERYAIERELARGGMGVVYRARDLTFGRTVAVKITLPGVSGDAFVREAEITARLQHPGIPPVHALCRLPDGRRFLAMKLISGETLRALLDGRPDPTADRGRLVAAFEQICQAVGYAHAQGIIHRDLKPANVMVGEFGEVQVMDWGLAKEVRSTESGPGNATSGTASGAEETVFGSPKGTPVYMPPEQARGEWATVGPRSDVFALGGILCAILTGKPPFSGTDVYDIGVTQMGHWAI